MIHILGSSVVLLLGHFIPELVGALLGLHIFFLFHLGLELLLPQLFGYLLILELLSLQLLLSSICLLFLDGLIKLLILQSFVPFDDV